MNGYTRYPKKVKLIMMDMYFNKGYSKSIITEKFNVNKDTLKKWIRLFKVHGEKAFDVNKSNKRIFDNEFKKEVVEEIINGESIKNTSIKHNIDTNLVRAWIKWYNSLEENKDKDIEDMKYYKFTPEKKIEIAKFCIDNNYNYSLTAKEYKIPYSTVYNWTNKYSKEGVESLKKNTRGKKTQEEKNEEFNKLRIEILKDFKKKRKHLEQLVKGKTLMEIREMIKNMK